MVQLVVIACLIAHPAECDSFDVPFYEPTGMRQCLFKGQLRIVQWLEEMPGWQVRRWRCELPGA